MIQSIYTLVSNANLVPCNRKNVVKSDPIPLLRNNYLGEYRTALEKAKVRKNLGIADEVVMEWGNLSGFIENLKDLVAYVEDKWHYTLPDDITNITEELTNIQEAINYAIKYVSTFKSDTDSIIFLKEEAEKLNTQVVNLDSRISKGETDIKSIQEDIETINSDIKKLNESLLAINVDASILEWIKKHTSDSIELTEEGLEVKISESENNALKLDATGLHVNDISLQVSLASLDILNLSENVNTILDTYVTKEQLGGEGDFNFVNQDDFNLHKTQADNEITNIKLELAKTVKTGEDGHVDTLYVNTLSNQEGNIKINKSLEVSTGIPLDIRTVVKSTEDLYKLPLNTAYAGMAVANASNGYIYILMDPTRISEKSGWKASYESIQIITCTQEEYEAMAANTNDDYTYKEEGKPFLYEDTYYYIYENEEKSQYYVTSKQIEEWLKAKASATDVTSLSSDFSKHIKSYEATVELFNILKLDITDNYNTAEQIAEIYTTKEALQNTDSKFENYSTSEEITKTLEDYVTKDSLRGGLEGEDDFVFVTLNQYNSDKEANLEKITTNQLVLTQDEVENAISVLDNALVVNSKLVAYKEEVPKILLVETKAEFEEMEKDPDTYYYVCDDEAVGYLTNITAGEQFYTKLLVNNLIALSIQKLIDEYIVPLLQEIATLKSVQS